MQVVGNLAEIRPEALDIPDWDKMVTNYARDIGVRESEIHDLRDVQAERQARAQQAQQQQAAEAVPPAAQAAKTLSETEVGGGGSALDQLLGG